MPAASDPPSGFFTICRVLQGVLFVIGSWQVEHRPSCLRQTRCSFPRPRGEFSMFLPHRDSKYCSHLRSCGFALALILICRWIGVSDACSRMSSRCVPSSCFSVVANTHFRAPLVLKYFSLIHRAPLFGCLLAAHRHSIDQTLSSTRAKVSLATTWL